MFTYSLTSGVLNFSWLYRNFICRYKILYRARTFVVFIRVIRRFVKSSCESGPRGCRPVSAGAHTGGLDLDVYLLFSLQFDAQVKGFSDYAMNPNEDKELANGAVQKENAVNSVMDSGTNCLSDVPLRKFIA